MNAMSFIPATSSVVTGFALSATATKVLEVKQTGLRAALGQLERLEQERLAWEGEELESARRRLYAMLTECYGFYLTLKTSAAQDIRQQHREALAAFLETRGLTKALASSHDMSKIVRAVFGVDRRRVSAYSIALRKALESGGLDSSGKVTPLPASALSSWLAEHGGVEEVRLGSKQGMTAKQRAEVAQVALRDAVLMRIKPDARTMPFSTDDADRTVLVVATYRPTGELEVSAVVRNDAAVRAALAAHYSADKDAVTAAANKAVAVEVAPTAIAVAMEEVQTRIAA